jgi:hypothetical protein
MCTNMFRHIEKSCLSIMYSTRERNSVWMLFDQALHTHNFLCVVFLALLTHGALIVG